MMKFTSVAFATLCLVPLVNAVELQDQKDKVSYSIGANIGKGLKSDGLEVKPEILMQGLTDAFSGAELAMTPEAMNEAMMALQKEMMAKMEAKQKELAEKNKAASTKFLEENKGKEGVKTTGSGLQYKVITEGKGEKPTEKSMVVVHYKGTTIDGTEFDSSYKRNEAASIPVGGVIPGWKEGIQLMSVGSKYQFFIPSHLAYGPQAPQEIGPDQALIFEVELISIQKPEAQVEAKPATTKETPVKSKKGSK